MGVFRSGVAVSSESNRMDNQITYSAANQCSRHPKITTCAVLDWITGSTQYNPSEQQLHPINFEISYPLGHLPDGSDMMQNLLMLWWLLLVMMKMQLLPLIPMPWLMLRCGQVCVQSYNSRGRRSQIVSVSAYNSMVWVLSEIKSNVLQWHRSVGMFVHS